MSRVLLTAFEPFDIWRANSSWLALIELTRDLPPLPKLTTRRYPVDFDAVRQHIEEDLAQSYDFVVHLGQAAGKPSIELETVALNLATKTSRPDGPAMPLAAGQPLAYQTALPVGEYQSLLQQANIPSRVSFHAGTYVCNAAYYWTQHQIATRQLATQAILIHLPLETAQAAAESPQSPSLPSSVAADAIRLILQRMAGLQ